MNLDWTCNKCLKVFPKVKNSFVNTIKGFRFCEKCFDYLKLIDEKLTEGWDLYVPQTNSQEGFDKICDCNCHDEY